MIRYSHKKISTIVILFVFCLLITLFYNFVQIFKIDTNIENNKCLRKKKLEFQTIVENIIDDPNDVHQKIIVLKNAIHIETYYTNGLWEKFEINDSVVKKKETYILKIYKNREPDRSDMCQVGLRFDNTEILSVPANKFFSSKCSRANAFMCAKSINI